MFNNSTKKTFVIFFTLGCIWIKAQDITFVPQDTLLVDTLGAEIVFTIQITNISMQDQIFYMVRTINDLPTYWQSSLCFDFCWAPFIDSIATTADFNSSPLSPGESREISVHIFPLNNPGTAHVQIKGGTFRSPNIMYYADFYAIVNPTSVNDNAPAVNDFSLSQNYPNPFNPSTKIKYTVPALSQRERVILQVFDIFGREVAILVNEDKSPGTYEVEFKPASSIGVNSNQHPASSIPHLSSGIYLYRLSVGGFSQTRKMILEK